jgi:hypothetical protein
VTSLLKLCCYTTTLTPSDADTSATPNIDMSLRSSATKTNYATNTMCQKFNIRTPNKAALVMELVGEMKSLEKKIQATMLSKKQKMKELTTIKKNCHDLP